MNKIEASPLLKKGQSKNVRAVGLCFVLGCITAAAFFLPFYILDKGFYVHAGDFNLQQIPFYMHVQGFLRSIPNGTWSWATDMGSSIVTSYSFYNIGSPFLWLSLLFPTRWVPYLIVPLLVLKFGCTAAAANLYLSRYGKTRSMTLIISLVFAFCGFNVYNIFFNHMLEPVLLFTLMIWAMDEYFYENKKGWFAITVGLALLNSYFFFIGNVVFLVIYFLVKVYHGDYKLTLPKFAGLALEAVLGAGIGMALLLPSVFTLLQNPRIDNFAVGFNMLLYKNSQQYFAIISSMFLPPDPPYWPNLFTDGIIRHTSMSAFLPVVSVAGVIAYFKSRRKGAVRTMLIISLIMAMVPILNSSFYAFNSSYYARWYYMPILFMCLATLNSLEDRRIDIANGAKWAFGLTALYAIFGLIPNAVDGEKVMGVAQQASRFWLTILLAILGIGIFWFLVKYQRHRKRFASLFLAVVMSFTVVYSVIHIALTKLPQYERDIAFKTEMYDSGGALTLPDDVFYRTDTYEVSDNFGLWADLSNLRTFNSTVSPSIMEFYPFVGVKRDVASRPDDHLYALRGFLSVRFMIVDQNYETAFLNTAIAKTGWTHHSNQGTLVVYENDNFVPLGFTYSQYTLMDQAEMVAVEYRANLMMDAILLNEEQAAQYGYLFSERLEVTSFSPTLENYLSAAQSRIASGSYQSSGDETGFRCRINMEKENLVFFSVPYEEGFSATVNGEEAEVLKVSSGMMAVYAPAGDNEIIFTYKTKGFGMGLAISCISIAVLAVYMYVMNRSAKKKAVLLPGPASQPEVFRENEMEIFKMKELLQEESVPPKNNAESPPIEKETAESKEDVGEQT